MHEIKEAITQTFGNKLRIRVSGICIENDKLLMIKHHYLGKEGYLWSPPGGGMEYGQNAEQTLKREFLEETGLSIMVEKFLFVNEFLAPPLHAIELFFKVKKTAGKLTRGSDPEMRKNQQIINEIRYLSFSELKNEGTEKIHNIFHDCHTLEDLLNKNGYFKF
jgi:8-oxo-dGTP diphosphatase